MFRTRFFRALSLAFALAIIIGTAPPIGALAHDTPGRQVVDAGGETGGLTDITAEKTIRQITDGSGADVENQFEVTLRLTTPKEVSEIVYTEQGASVVLVVDCSASMNGTPITQAKAAAKAFAEKFSKASNVDTVRQIALVSFGTTASTKTNSRTNESWFDVNQNNNTLVGGSKKNPGKTDLGRLDDQINTLNTGGNYTNLDDGLREASDLIDDLSGSEPKYVILLSDGGPNRWSNDADDDWTGLNASMTVGGPTPKGMMAALEAIQLFDEDTYFIAIAYTTGSSANINAEAQYFWGEGGSGASTTTYGGISASFSGQDEYAGRPNAANSALSLRTYLNELVSFHPGYSETDSESKSKVLAASANVADDLSNIFNVIAGEITSPFANFWVLRDAMGANIKWEGDEYADENDDIISLELNDLEQDELVWRLRLEPELDGRDQNETARLVKKEDTFEYTYKYLVELDTLAAGFEKGEEYDANSQALVHYTLSGDSADRTATFQVPSVEGYTAPFKIKKEFYSDNDAKLVPTGAGALPPKDVRFKLTTGDDDSWGGEPITPTAVQVGSAWDWYVDFGELPSGHDYDLTEQEWAWHETTAEEDRIDANVGNDDCGDWAAAGAWTVKVSFGDLSLLDGGGKAVAGSGGVYTIRNDYVPKVITGGSSGGGGDDPPEEEKEDEESKEEEKEDIETVTTGGGIDTGGGDTSYPFDVGDGQTILPQDDGSYLVLDEDGVPLGSWVYHPELEEWIFDEATPLANLPQTGEALPGYGGYGGAFTLLGGLALLAILLMAAALRRRA
ncbi:MAG: VWA domain-containing protein [Clostridiales Family XIII bacterium]|jgi:uncharacterized protein YegL|nr:VWA domain-containing protein [Clostridiales Family XIII bacterium]